MSISATIPFSTNLLQRLTGLLLLLLLCGCAANDTRSRMSPVENQLMAEIALQRGEYLIAAQEYLVLAEQSDNPDYAQRATELAYDYSFLVYAMAAAERWAGLQPEDQLVHAYLGRLYLRSNMPGEAFGSLDISLGPADRRTDADYFLLSAELAELTAPARGLEVFRLFNESYPGNPAITGSLASLAYLAGNTGLAVDAARETLLLAPDLTITRVWLAQYLLADGQRSSAFEQMAFALEMQPGLEMEIEFIRLLVRADEFEDARQRLERMLSRYPDEPDLIRLRGTLSLQLQDYQAATEDFSYLLSEAYYVGESFWYLGQIAYEQEQYLQAIRFFKRVGEGSRQTAAVNAISRSYLALGDVNTALTVQREYLIRFPREVIPQAPVRAELLAAADQLPEAIETMDSAIEFDPWNEALWLSRGALYERAGDMDEALDSFREACRFAPNDAGALNALGFTLTITGRDYDEAYELISRALELQPDNPAIMDSMGWILFKTGDKAAARGWLEKAYENYPDPEIAAHLGELLWVEGEPEAAREVWMSSLEQNPDSRVLNETMERLLP